jgi:uncharacterized protein YerC
MRKERYKVFDKLNKDKVMKIFGKIKGKYSKHPLHSQKITETNLDNLLETIYHIANQEKIYSVFKVYQSFGFNILSVNSFNGLLVKKVTNFSLLTKNILSPLLTSFDNLLETIYHLANQEKIYSVFKVYQGFTFNILSVNSFNGLLVKKVTNFSLLTKNILSSLLTSFDNLLETIYYIANQEKIYSVFKVYQGFGFNILSVNSFNGLLVKKVTNFSLLTKNILSPLLTSAEENLVFADFFKENSFYVIRDITFI